ncbi:MAG TPA: periplasmic heavy metal sensor [Hyphomonadaceae bacterium]|nr:periplasmic heavy metal sensor [Hyphomonadaceae bacterium]
MPSRTSLFLIASLAVNAALLGVVGGGLLNKQHRPNSEGQAGPPQSEVAAAWAQLPDSDRAELRKRLRDGWNAMEGDRKLLLDAGKNVHDIAMSDPFDGNKLRDALTIYQQRQRRMQENAEDILISYFSKMPPAARGTAAVGLLTPFNARVQRADGRKDERGPGPALGPLKPNGQPGGSGVDSGFKPDPKASAPK